MTLIFAFALSLNALAASGYSKLASFGVIYAQGVYFADKYGSFYVLDADKDSSLLYTSMISYDDLSGICSEVNASGVNCTLHKNIESGYWVIAVNDPVIFNSVVGLIGNTDGYVYVAEIDTTGEDSVDLLSKILTRLILVESYVKSTYFELWEQGGVLDDIYDVIDSIDSYVYDIKDRLYYNGKSAAYYLYKIESHLATIANGSGSSSSSSGTDLTGVLEWLETATGLIGHTQLGVDAVNAHLGVVTQYLYEISTKLDGVSTMVTDLATVKTYLYWIDSDVEDVLESLDTATGLIGTISLDTDVLVAGMGVTQDLIAAANTNLTTMINKQELVFDYLADLSGDLGTVISKQNSALSVLETVKESLTSVSNRLLYDGGSLAYWSYRINHFLRNDFATKLDSVIALLQQEGAFTTDLSGVLTDLETMIENQNSVLALLQEDGAFTTDISGVLENQQSILTLLQQSLILEDESAIFILHDMRTFLSKALSNQGAIAEIVDGASTKLESILTLLQQSLTLEDEPVVFILHDMRSFLSKALSNQEKIGEKLDSVTASLPVLQSMSESLATISNRLYYVDASVSYYVWNISSQLRNNLPILIANQEATIVNQQKLIDLIEDLELTTNVTIENIENITIDVTNKAYEVFYITDSEGNEQNLADFSGDVLTISGRLLNFFFKVAFDDALDSVDSALDDMTEFYIDDSVLVGGGSLWE